MADLELGNIMFNTNKNQILNCPNWVIALLEDINNLNDIFSSYLCTRNIFKNF